MESVSSIPMWSSKAEDLSKRGESLPLKSLTSQKPFKIQIQFVFELWNREKFQKE